MIYKNLIMSFYVQGSLTLALIISRVIYSSVKGISVQLHSVFYSKVSQNKSMSEQLLVRYSL